MLIAHLHKAAQCLVTLNIKLIYVTTHDTLLKLFFFFT